MLEQAAKLERAVIHAETKLSKAKIRSEAGQGLLHLFHDETPLSAYEKVSGHLNSLPQPQLNNAPSQQDLVLDPSLKGSALRDNEGVVLSSQTPVSHRPTLPVNNVSLSQVSECSTQINQAHVTTSSLAHNFRGLFLNMSTSICTVSHGPAITAIHTFYNLVPGSLSLLPSLISSSTNRTSAIASFANTILCDSTMVHGPTVSEKIVPPSSADYSFTSALNFPAAHDQ